MCSKTTRSSPRNRSMKKRKLKPQRKTRSLQRDFSPPASTTNSPESVESSHDHQLNLFPLHPDSFDEEKEVVDDYFFDTADTTTAPTLNGLLWSTSGEGGRGCAVSSEEDSLCPTLAYAYRGGEDHSEEVGSRTTAAKARLERSALRGGNKERDLSEERWVCYEEVTSCVPDYPNKIKTEEEGVEGGGLLLSLKLDYDEIMNAWSDKGPLYIDADGSQIVPDLLHDALRQDISHGFLDGGSVPQMEGSEGEIWKMRTREARVLRYKEKRQNRLFAKRIRYEVRKLNAEKRPRMKGRFVKRS